MYHLSFRRMGSLVALGAAAGAFEAGAAEQPAEKSAAAEEAKPVAPWKSSAAVGMTLTRGNSETLTVNGTVETSRQWSQNEAALGASVTYGEEKDEVTASSMSGYGQYNRLFGERFYAFGRADALHDDLADLAYRVTLSPGAGCYFLKNKKFTLSGELGPSMVFERLGGENYSYWTLRVGEKFGWQVNERARLWQRLDYSPQTDDLSDYVVNAEVGFETDITKRLGLRVVALDTYRSEPAPGREANDFKLITGISYKF